jgi:hypothetical protein
MHLTQVKPAVDIAAGLNGCSHGLWVALQVIRIAWDGSRAAKEDWCLTLGAIGVSKQALSVSKKGLSRSKEALMLFRKGLMPWEYFRIFLRF